MRCLFSSFAHFLQNIFRVITITIKTTLPGKEMRGVEEEESQILINSSHQEMESIASAH